jgi:hypothetical protein
MKPLLPHHLKGLKISQLRNLYREIRGEVFSFESHGGFTDTKAFDEFAATRLKINSVAKSALPREFVLFAASQLQITGGKSQYSNGSGKCGGLNNFPVMHYDVGNDKLSEILKKHGVKW